MGFNNVIPTPAAPGYAVTQDTSPAQPAAAGNGYAYGTGNGTGNKGPQLMPVNGAVYGSSNNAANGAVYGSSNNAANGAAYDSSNNAAAGNGYGTGTAYGGSNAARSGKGQRKALTEEEKRELNDGKTKAIFGSNVTADFKLNLQPPTGENSADMEGRYSSVALTVTKNGVSVRHNLDTTTVEALYNEALRHAYHKAGEMKLTIPEQAAGTLKEAANALAAAIGMLQQSQNPWQPVNAAVGMLNSVLGQIQADEADTPFSLTETKIMPTVGPDGYAKVTKVRIQRSDFRKDKSGTMKAANYPWQFTVENFEAKPRKTSKGGTDYDPTTVRKGAWGEPASIYADDRTILSRMSKMLRYMRVFDSVANSKIIRTALEKAFYRQREYEGRRRA